MENPTFSGATIGTAELAARFGLEANQRAALVRRLNSHNIPFFRGREGPWTTLDALNYAFGVRRDSPFRKAITID